ncbi:hypothetical protein C0Q70_00471 [Pomacea canaliculata]|uniref:DUF7802 domain-containing protein n=1 Tax=Pomacea canaliculata TaxID=400727 RepID=A0A2T7PWT0_POMCA|nr:hypothetical protein C0Q70_00471 [Pomacea canaliculata]
MWGGTLELGVKLIKDLNWWIRFRAPQDILKNHATFLYCEIVFYCLGFLTLLHALRNGGRYPWLWLATVLHGLTVECVSYAFLDIDNFWHAQSMVMLLGQRLPLHILFVYPAFIYTASIAVSHMNLRWWAEPFAVGLGAVLLDIPFDIMGVKLLWWTWHDDDPNIFDRHYWVPWTSYYFHAAFSSSLVLVFHGVRAICCRREFKFQSSGFICELLCALVTGLFSMPLGILQFAPVYHPLHDLFGIHSEVCVLMLICLYILIVWSADRYPFETARTFSSSRKSKEIFLAVLLHYSFYIYLVLFSKPETSVSIGYHQRTGPCGVTVPVHTPFGMVLSKTRFLCVDAYYEDYFDFHCVKVMPGDEKEWAFA